MIPPDFLSYPTGSARTGVELHTIDANRRAVDEDVAKTSRLFGSESFGVGRKVAYAARRAGADRLGIEHAHVRPAALAQIAAPHEPEHVSWFTGQLPHGRFERQHGALTDPCAQQVCRQGCVAELVDVRTRVRKTEHGRGMAEQLA